MCYWVVLHTVHFLHFQPNLAPFSHVWPDFVALGLYIGCNVRKRSFARSSRHGAAGREPPASAGQQCSARCGEGEGQLA